MRSLIKFYYFYKVLDSSGRAEVFDKTLPGMVAIALCLPTLCTQVLYRLQPSPSLTGSQTFTYTADFMFYCIYHVTVSLEAVG